MKQGKFGLTFWVVAVPLAGLLLYFSLRGVDWPKVGEMLASAQPFWVVVGVLGVILSTLVRAVRWRVLLNAQANASYSMVFAATSAGYFGNNFLPLRAGELIRTFMVSASTGLSKSYVLTTGMSERVADAVTLVGISAAILMSGIYRPDWLGQAAKPFAVLGVCGLLSIVLLPKLEGLVRTILAKLPLPEKVRHLAGDIIGHVLEGLRSFHDPKRLAQFVALTAVVWTCDAFTTTLSIRALGMSMSLPAAFMLISAMGLGSAVPSTPGYVGVYQFVAVTVLVPFGYSRTDAIAFIFLAQIQQYVAITLMGIYGLWKYRAMQRESTQPVD